MARTTRSTRLTPAGESFLRRSRRILSDVDSAISELRNPSAPKQGTVTFACIPTIAGEMFPRIIRQYTRKHPDVMVEIVDEETVAMERRIMNREVDFGVGGIPRRSELAFSEVFADPFVFVCNREHPLARRARVSLAEALEYPAVSLARESNVRQTINAYCAGAGLEFNSAFEVIHHYTVGAMVEAGLGITLLPSQATVLMNSSALKIIPFEEPNFARPIGVITRRDEALSTIADDFCAFTVRSIRAMPDAARRRPARTKTKAE